MRRLSAAATFSALCSVLAGCGLVFQGRTQAVMLRTTPAGATASLDGAEVVAPGTATITRERGWVVARASAPGYQAACRLVSCRRSPAFVVFDAMCAVWPLFVDLYFQTLRYCPSEIALTLRPLEGAAAPRPLPPDDAILDAWTHGKVNICNPYFEGRGR